MDLLSALGGAKVQVVPLDMDGLALPERALLPEWVAYHWQRRKEAQDAADKARKSK